MQNLSREQICFNSHIGSQKPESIINRNTSCPFCDRSGLSDILAEQYPIIWLKNKYPVLEDTLQTVLIETDDCNAELSNYPKDLLHNLIRFGVSKWLEMDASGEFASVLFYKNHGPYSGGTIRHPHMQIVGLKQVDYRKNLRADYFSGPEIAAAPGVELNVSTQPKIGFFEFNVSLTDQSYIDCWADYIQITVHYIMHHFHKNCSSYNLFFYQHQSRIVVKIMPRFVTSPLYIGYSIPQVSNRLDEVVREFQQIYFLGDR
ncbi:DUF4931 domain-containing protein [Acetonema longum]|uniref:Galactose-1-phosphate uridylyltransferase n=1 Tax=Acetonema longum DSM 6540 TaxID=1009370 RepID=F7NHS4_9FIRM|nr:DUF4931 domain-containing protein [Acetonema longum]EGO64449.1 galactose-1-phosphate uridylyltransferase [Acetonema longum DSM 6540]